MSIAAGALFVLALAVIALDWVHRTKTALVGAGLFVVIGILDLEQAADAGRAAPPGSSSSSPG